MKIKEVIAFLESWAPLDYQDSYDNAGLQVGNPEDELRGGLVCLDVTPEVLEEAVGKGCNLVVSHHPVLFRPLRQVAGNSLSEQVVIYALTHGLVIYSAHTNLDNVSTGVNACFCRLLQLENQKILQAKPGLADVGSGAIGMLSSVLSEEAFAAHVKQRLQLHALRCSLPHGRLIRKVAVCGGAGAFLIPDALRAGADAFVVGEAHYHDFVDYQGRIFILEVGHYESECCIKSELVAKLNEKFCTFAVSEKDGSPYYYL